MDALSSLLRLAPYGLAPFAGAYGAYRGGRSLVGKRKRTARRIPRSLNVKGIHTFRRTAQFPMAYSPANGVAYGTGTGNSVAITFSLADINVKVGSGVGSAGVPNATELTSLFDKWCISKVTVRLFFQDNSSSTGVTATNMPLLNYVWDNSDNTIEVLSDINQHPSVKRFQFGSGTAKNGCLTTTGYPQGHLLTGDAISGGTATTGSRPEPKGTWFDTTTPSVSHYCLKMVFDPIGATQVSSEGSFSFYVDVTYKCKDVI